MNSHFTFQDLSSISIAILAFGVLLLPIGYLTGWISNVLEFRKADLTEKLLLSIVFSFAVFPIVVNLIGRWIALRYVALFALLLILPCSILLFRTYARPLRPISLQLSPLKRIALWLGFAWILLCLISLADLQLGSSLYPSVASFDHGSRIEYISSAIRRGVPVINPFFYGGSPTTSRYYYYWYVVCAVPASLFGLLPRHVLFASSVWAGFALAAIIPVYLKHFFRDADHLTRKSLIGIALLTITGLDLLPVALMYLGNHIALGDMEWWDPDEVTSWIDALLWVPHHVAALVATLVGLLVLAAPPSVLDSTRNRIAAVVVAALAFASAAGMSFYVVMGFALFLPVWVARLVLKRRWISALAYSAAALGAILISLPYLKELTNRSRDAENYASLVFGLRGQEFLARIGLHGAWNAVMAVVVLICICGLEFGFFGLMAAIQLRQDLANRRSLSEPEITAWYLVVCSLLVAIFIRSTFISILPRASFSTLLPTNNDLGIRSIMFAQFIFLLWGARILNRRLDRHWHSTTAASFDTKLLNFLLGVTLALGGLATLYQVVMLRLYPVLADQGHVQARQASGPDTFLLRSAYEELATRVPTQSIVQANPDSLIARDLLLYSNHQAVDAFAPDCGTVFGGSLIRCQQVQDKIRNIFQSPLTDWSNLDTLCDSLFINVLLTTRDDAIWQNQNSWVWRRNPLVANNFVRAFSCGGHRHP